MKSFSPLLLSSKGLFEIASNGISPFEASGSFWRKHATCIVARASYWEKVVTYPTSNLLELSKIINSSLGTISPIPGVTKYYIIKIKNNKSTILYCCFPEKVITKAESHSLWRLIPESLIIYRHYEGSIYFSDKHFGIIAKINESTMHSLPSENKNSNISITLNDDSVKEISYSEYLSAFYKKNVYAFGDLFSQLKTVIDKARKRWTHLTPHIKYFLISSIFSYVLLITSYTVIYNNKVKDNVSTTRQEAVRSLQVRNDLKKAYESINALNQDFERHPPKLILLKKIASISESLELTWENLTISPTEITISGKTKNATALLSALTALGEFEKVQFLNPPATLRDGNQRFNINAKISEAISE